MQFGDEDWLPVVNQDGDTWLTRGNHVASRGLLAQDPRPKTTSRTSTKVSKFGEQESVYILSYLGNAISQTVAWVKHNVMHLVSEQQV